MRRSITAIVADWGAVAPTTFPDGETFPVRTHLDSLAKVHASIADLEGLEGEWMRDSQLVLMDLLCHPAEPIDRVVMEVLHATCVAFAERGRLDAATAMIDAEATFLTYADQHAVSQQGAAQCVTDQAVTMSHR